MKISYCIIKTVKNFKLKVFKFVYAGHCFLLLSYDKKLSKQKT